MQYEFNNSSQDSNTRRVQDTSILNHGDDSTQSLSSQPSAEEGRAKSRSPSSYRTPSEASSQDNDDNSEWSERALSIPPRKTGSPVDKILEHERASVHRSKKKRGGTAFTVVSRTNEPNSNGSSILDFPNGRNDLFILRQQSLMLVRGPHPHFVSFATSIAIQCFFRVETLS